MNEPKRITDAAIVTSGAYFRADALIRTEPTGERFILGSFDETTMSGTVSVDGGETFVPFEVRDWVKFEYDPDSDEAPALRLGADGSAEIIVE